MFSPPKFTAGQYVMINDTELADVSHSKCASCPAMVLYPDINGDYLLQLHDFSYCKTHETNLRGIKSADCITEQHREQANAPEFLEPIRNVMLFGNGGFAVPTMQALVSDGYNVTVVTRPDFVYEGKHISTSVKRVAKTLGLKVYEPRRLESPRTRRKIMAAEPHVGLVADFSQLPDTIYNIPLYGCICLHPSLLPSYRGCSPVVSAILDGQGTTGASVYIVNDIPYGGNLINNIAIDIHDDENSIDVTSRLAVLGATLVTDAIRRLESGTAYPIEQSRLYGDFILPRPTSRVNRSDRKIQWCNTRMQVVNTVRAYVLSNGAWGEFHGLGDAKPIYLKILHATIPTDDIRPLACGEIMRCGDRLFVGCADGPVELNQIQEFGHPQTSVAEYVNSHNICKGFFSLL